MAKAKTSRKHKALSKNIPKIELRLDTGVKPCNPLDRLINEEFIGKAILECLKNNDPEGVMEVISIYISTLNKVKAAQQSSLPRSTLYYNLKSKNPTVKTLAKIFSITTQENEAKRK